MKQARLFLALAAGVVAATTSLSVARQSPPTTEPPANPAREKPAVVEPGVIPVGPPANPERVVAVGAAAKPTPTTTSGPAESRSFDPVRMMLEEIDRLNEEILALRRELADARLESASVNRELSDLRQFLEDNQRLGNDFQQYRGVLDTSRQTSRQEQLQRTRAEYEQRKAERLTRMQEARAQRAEQRAERDRLGSYEKRGFSSLGLDVFIGQMAYSYHAIDNPTLRIGSRYGWRGWGGWGRWGGGWGLGSALRVYPNVRADFKRMTISGSVLNASEQTRNIGVAVTFFDEFGNQVGHEIVQIKNARPDVPYPFTSTIEMALDRHFASSSQYVLYADPLGE